MGEFVLRLVALVPSPSHPPSYRRRFRRRPPFETTATLGRGRGGRGGGGGGGHVKIVSRVLSLVSRRKKKNYRTLEKPLIFFLSPQLFETANHGDRIATASRRMRGLLRTSVAQPSSSFLRSSGEQVIVDGRRRRRTRRRHLSTSARRKRRKSLFPWVLHFHLNPSRTAEVRKTRMRRSRFG